MLCAWLGIGMKIKSCSGKNSVCVLFWKKKKKVNARQIVHATIWWKHHSLHFTEGVAHCLVVCLFHRISCCSFWCCFLSFLSLSFCSFLLFFCWLSTLEGFTQRNQFCLASLPLERNTGVYKYSHAAISDPQLRDWSSGWAVLLFDHEGCIHVSLWMSSLSLSTPLSVTL